MKPVPTAYSGTPLAKKLGVNPGTVMVTISAPKHFAALLEPLPAGARVTTVMPPVPDFVHIFSARQAHLLKHLRRLRTGLDPDGVVWVSWPKKSAKMLTDITEDVIRALALPLGFVDVKVCAVDAVWSGLKLVIRKELRSR